MMPKPPVGSKMSTYGQELSCGKTQPSARFGYAPPTLQYFRACSSSNMRSNCRSFLSILHSCCGTNQLADAPDLLMARTALVRASYSGSCAPVQPSTLMMTQSFGMHSVIG